MSEYIFIKEGERYDISDVADGKSSVVASGFISVNSLIPALSLSTQLPSSIAPASNSAVILSGGIEFHQEINGIYYLLKQQGCMKVVEVV